MPYTLGTIHAGLSGAGQFAIAQPLGLKLTLSGVPSWIGRDDGTPQTLFRVGSLTPGNADGWGSRIHLEHTAQLVLPLMPDASLLAYDLVAGATMTITELLAVPPANSALNPWDRSPTSWIVGGYLFVAGGAAGTLFTYTVPAGRLLLVGSGEMTMLRTAAAGTPALTYLQMKRAGTTIMDLDRISLLAQLDRATLSPGGLVLLPGETLTANYSSGSTGGQEQLTATATGYTFAL